MRVYVCGTDTDVGKTTLVRLLARACDARGLTCDIVDLRFSSEARLRSYRTLVVPPFVQQFRFGIEELGDLEAQQEMVVLHS